MSGGNIPPAFLFGLQREKKGSISDGIAQVRKCHKKRYIWSSLETSVWSVSHIPVRLEPRKKEKKNADGQPRTGYEPD